jgi:hypothetical protein
VELVVLASRSPTVRENVLSCLEADQISFTPLERAHMQPIGIEKGKPFAPDDKRRALLAEAAVRLGLPGLRRRLPRRREELPAPHPGRRADQQLLVDRRLRRA